MNHCVPDEQDRLDVVAYLKKVSVKP